MVDGYPNYHYLTASVDGIKALLESGINAVREVKGVDGFRRPVIGIRSSPWKAGSETTPWHDVFDLDHGRVRYFGDHKISTPGPLGSTTGNAALLRASELHRGPSRRDRLLAPPVMIFRAVSANGAVKGYVQFCGVAVIERVEPLVQSDPQTGLEFPNYMFDLLVVDASREGDEVDWRWIDDRRDPTRSLEQTLRFAPAGWREWVDGGTAVLSQTREASVEPGDSPPAHRRSVTSEQFDDELFGLIAQAVCPGQVIKTLGTARPNRIVSIDRDGLRVETDKSIREGREPQLVPASMVISAWRYLLQHGRLSQEELLNELNVKRSAFVCALLAHFRGVEVGEDGNIVLRLVRRARDDAEPSVLAWPMVCESNDPAATPYTAIGPWPGSATYASRLNDLFNSVRAADGGALTSADVADALQADGLAVHADSIDRLRAGTGSRPSDQLSFALAFFFDVDPEYFLGRPDAHLNSVEDGPVAARPIANWQAAETVSDYLLPQAQFVKLLAGLTKAASQCLDAPRVDQQLSDRLALIIADAAPLMIESVSGEVLVPSRLAARIMATWKEADPLANGTKPEFDWAAGILGAPRL